ncbi:hypothetical protein [Acinetobacter sp. 10FS3-1]|uniref:hypothetical protein n=1 Tax=Acinetobacter sp. 10FS3-1 TaxID=2563897 RepID=UPI00157CE474|nr:hypothetical protein [Acinetobacter sp. 10FS3-1]QKQ70584.1 hypothetical protein E5Y90_10260 [Acinetobacter sp. 10FS3-1]
MSELKSFNFARLQLQHPDAFFLKLHYSRFKFSTLQKIQFVIALNLLSLLICLLCSLGSIALEYYFFHEAQAAFNMSLMLLITLFYPYMAYIQYQAKFSSKVYAAHLQHCLYLHIPIFLGLLVNLYLIHSDWLVILSMLLVSVLLGGATILEPFFKPNTSVLDQVRLQKLRQLAFWAYQQSRSQSPQYVPDQPDLPAYYKSLHIRCMQEEQQLLQRIRFTSFKDYFKNT